MATFSFYDDETAPSSAVPRLITDTETIFFLGVVRIASNDSADRVTIKSQFGDNIEMNSENDTINLNGSQLTGTATEIAARIADFLRLFMNNSHY